MHDKNIVLESFSTTKDILERLNNPCSIICLFDYKDNSKITIDSDLLKIINRYYRDKCMGG